MNKQILDRYAEIKRTIKILTTEADTLEAPIKEAMLSSLVEKIELETGTLTLTSRKKWTYGESVKKIETNLKETKKKEEEDGVAKLEETKILVFR